MKKGLVIISTILFFVLFPTTSFAAQNDDNNGIIKRVSLMIAQVIEPIKINIGLLTGRVEKIENTVQNNPNQEEIVTEAVKTVNEDVAIDSILGIWRAQNIYSKEDKDNNGQFDYAERLDQLFRSGNLIDNVLVGGVKQGYTYTIQINPNANIPGWNAVAKPKKINKTGNRSFYIDETGVIRASSSGEIGPQSPPLKN